MRVDNESEGLATMSMESILQRLDDGRFTSELLVKTYIERIKQVDPIVKSIAQLNPDAVTDAIERDQERRNGCSRGPLHGVPILLKDTFGTLDAMDTTGGSYALVGARPRFESTVVQKLRQAGAIILGKTTMSEFGYSRTPKAPNGWSPLHGQCTGAFFANQDPSGSSSGCGVATSLGLAAATIAGETFGSITYPADRNGVVGLKPTVGLTSRAGVMPIYKYQDTVGPIVQTVRDAALLLQVMAGKDPLDEATDDIPFSVLPDYLAACRSDAFQGARLAVPRSCISADYGPEYLSSFDQALGIIRSLGASIVDNAEFPRWTSRDRERNPPYEAILLREGLEGYFNSLEKNPNQIHTMADLVQFIKDTPGEQYETYGAEWLENARDAQHTTSDEEFRRMRAEMFDHGEEIQRFLDKHDCDAILVPTYTDIPYDIVGNPAISVPLGFYSFNVDIAKRADLVKRGPNVPYGLMFVGRQFSEEILLGLAFAFEQATGVGKYRQPYIRPTADLLSCGVSTTRPLYVQEEKEAYLMIGEDIRDEDPGASPLRIREMVSVSG